MIKLKIFKKQNFKNVQIWLQMFLKMCDVLRNEYIVIINKVIKYINIISFNSIFKNDYIMMQDVN